MRVTSAFLCLLVTACSAGADDATSSDDLIKKSGGPCAKLTEAQLRAAHQGFTCVTSAGATFEVVSKDVWRDQKSGISVSAVHEHIASAADGAKACAVGWVLPTGYPVSQNAANGSKDSDLMVLDKDAFTEAIVDVRGRWLWVSSPSSPYYQTVTFDPSADPKINYNYGNADGSDDAICVRR